MAKRFWARLMRRLVIASAVVVFFVLALLATAVLTERYWLPRVAAYVGAQFDLTMTDWQVTPDGRWHLQGLTWTSTTARLEATAVTVPMMRSIVRELLFPTAGWRIGLGQIEVGFWQEDLDEQEEAADWVVDLPEIFANAQRQLERWQSRIPEVEIGAVVVTRLSQTADPSVIWQFSTEAVTLRQRQMQTHWVEQPGPLPWLAGLLPDLHALDKPLLLPAGAVQFELGQTWHLRVAGLDEDLVLEAFFAAQTDGGDAGADVDWPDRDDQGTDLPQPPPVGLALQVDWATGQLTAAAGWKKNGLMPSWARMACDPIAWEVAGLPIDLPLQAVALERLAGDWNGLEFSLAIAATATTQLERLFEWAPDAEDVLPQRWQLDLDIRGDTEQIDMAALELVAPGVRVDLREPVRYQFAARRFSAATQLDLRVDLSELQFLALPSGSLTAALEIEDEETVHLRNARLLLGDWGIDLELRASADLATETITGAFTGSAQPTAALALPEAIVLDAPLRLVGELSGALLQPKIDAQLQAPQVRVEPAHPFAVSLDISGHIPESVDLHLQVDFLAADSAAAGLGVAANFAGSDSEGWRLRLQDGWIRDAAGGMLKLLQPSELRPITAVENAGGASGQLDPVATAYPFHLTPLVFQGNLAVPGYPDALFGPDVPDPLPESMLALAFDPHGNSYLRISGLGTEWLSGFGALGELPSLWLERIHLAADALYPVLALSGDAIIRGQSADGHHAKANMAVRLANGYMDLDSVSASIDGAPVVAGQLRFPVDLRWDATVNFWQPEVDFAAPISGVLDWLPSDPLIEILAAYGTIDWQQLQLSLVVGGTLRQPELTLNGSARAVQLHWDGLGGRPLPPLESVQFQLDLADQRLRVQQLHVQLAGASEIRLQAEAELGALWPMADDFVPNLLASARGELSLANWRGEAWAPFLPGVFRPTGQLSADLQLTQGMQFDGRVTMANFALRPTAALPSIAQIGMELELSGRRAVLRNGAAIVGDQPVRWHGELDFTNWQQPVWDVRLQGQRVQLLRVPEAILRADLDLRLRQTETAPARLTGALTMQSSTVLHDFDFLSGSTATGVAPRPPFFSVQAMPFADWGIDLQIDGTEFLRVRSAYFNALLSATFRLSGTLGDPLLEGIAFANRGEVRFPGATLRFNQAEAFITRERPDTVQIQLSGIAERASYVVSMDVSNTLDDPRVQFTSTPPLPNASIVRLLTTGGLSGNNLGGIGLYLGQGIVGPSSRESSFLNRLSIDVGREISRSGRNTMELSFELNDRWHIEGHYDRFDAYNLDFVWKVFEQ